MNRRIAVVILLIFLTTLFASPASFGAGQISPKTIYLTIDGGPSPEFSEIVLPVMQAHQCRVTWFVVGEHMMRHVWAARDLVRAGHEVEIHTWTHKPLTQLTNDEVLMEVEQCAAMIREWTGETPLFIRPPYGDHNARTDAIIRGLGYRVVMWDAEYPDFQPGTPDRLIESIAKQARPGAVVLLHVTRLTWKALPGLLNRLDRMGYRYGLLRDHPKYARP